MQQPLVQARPSLVLTCVVVLLGAVITAAGTSAGGVPRLTAPTSGHETSSTTDPWFQEAPKIAPSDEVGAGQFGTSVALSADGSTALIGGPDDNAGPAPPGSSCALPRVGAKRPSWSRTTKEEMVNSVAPWPCPLTAIRLSLAPPAMRPATPCWEAVSTSP